MSTRGTIVGERVREVLSDTVETISVCLKASHHDGMEWPICWQAAMWLAEKGLGVVDAQREWWDAVTYRRIEA